MAWIRKLLMTGGILRWRRAADVDAPPERGDLPPSTEDTLKETAENTTQTDRQINQIVESASRQTQRVERRAERTADVLRHMAEQACIISDATRSGRNHP